MDGGKILMFIRLMFIRPVDLLLNVYSKLKN